MQSGSNRKKVNLKLRTFRCERPTTHSFVIVLTTARRPWPGLNIFTDNFFVIFFQIEILPIRLRCTKTLCSISGNKKKNPNVLPFFGFLICNFIESLLLCQSVAMNRLIRPTDAELCMRSTQPFVSPIFALASAAPFRMYKMREKCNSNSNRNDPSPPRKL